MLLEFQQEIIDRLVEEDALCVIARGLGFHQIVQELCRICATDQALVLLLNASGLGPSVRQINSETLSAARRRIYQGGGVVSVTSRILVVDLLNQVVPSELVTGAIVLATDRLAVDSFALRVLRQQNPRAFVKALTESPEWLAHDFMGLETALKKLGLRHLHLWPRFHASVQRDLQDSAVPVAELRVTPTQSMTDIQQAVLDCLQSVLSELTRLPYLSTMKDELTIDNSLLRGFDYLVKQRLAPIWHRLGPRTRSSVSDLSALRKVSQLVTSYDCVALHRFLDSLVSSGSPPVWMESGAANVLYSVSRSRLFRKQPTNSVIEGLPKDVVPVLEVPPKLPLLANILDEVDEGPVVIMTGSLKESYMVREYLDTLDKQVVVEGRSHSRMMMDALKEFFAWKNTVTVTVPAPVPMNTQRSTTNAPPSKRRRQRGGSSAQMSRDSSSAAALERESASMAAAISSGLNSIYETEDDWSFDEHFGLLPAASAIHIHSYGSNPLESIAPRHIVMFTPNPQFIRTIELHQALHPHALSKVYFAVYDNSLEEQRYLTTIRRERQSFERLIRQQSSLAITIDDAPVSLMPARSLRSALSTDTPQIIVDVREFRAPLPSLLYESGIKVIPRTLNIGDYIIHNGLCVERKSLADLQQSLRSGRLFNQVSNMIRYYPTVVLLIEFEQNSSFSLQPIGSSAPEVAAAAMLSSLCLLCLQFPQLRVVWAPSPQESVITLGELKQRHGEPDPERAVSLGTEEDIDQGDTNRGSTGLLLRLPGITSGNYRKVSERFKNMAELCGASQEELEQVLGKAEATRLYQFLNARD